MIAAALALAATPSCKKRGDREERKDSPPGDPLGALPGAEPFSDELDGELRRARAAKGDDYAPRTRHTEADGSAKYTNRLILETSPYLLQHAHNPVNWYPWGDEAFETARKLGRPVLLSVGYSTCHWCHVMEEESFEDLDIARYLNEHYVAIKVDREERPDVDSIYMNAVTLISGRGGWPMTVWLTPGREPFFATSYLPPRTGDRGARIGFRELLEKMARRYDADPETVVAEAGRHAARIARLMEPPQGSGEVNGAAVMRLAAATYAERFDPAFGGLAGAPKFPSSLPARFLFRFYRRTGDEEHAARAAFTLAKMADGGIYDHVGGGFHRYATDARWRVPHFEKMLYDNARLVVAYLEAYQVTGEERFADVARDVLRYLSREMQAPGGAFYSATDADSRRPDGETVEGYFFTWTPAELRAALGEERAAWVAERFGVTEAGDADGRSILRREKELDEAEEARWRELREILYRARAARAPPPRDDKILAAWNGLAISAFARADLVLGGDDHAYAEQAARAARFVTGEMRDGGRLVRVYSDGAARGRGYLDDYAFVIAGLLDLFEATGEPTWLREAIALDRQLEEHYEADDGGYYLVADDHEELLSREKPMRDGALPSGNSVHALNLLRLHELTGDDDYRERAAAVIAAFSFVLARSPTYASELLLALDSSTDVVKQIVIVVPDERAEASAFLDRFVAAYVPSAVVAVVAEDDVEAVAKLAPIVEGKTAQRGEPTAYVCERSRCERPTRDPAVFAKQLEKVRSLD